MADAILLVVIGLVGGFAAGMLGIGGGAIYVPAMVLLLDENQHVAQGASLAAIVATGMVGALTHHRLQNVDERTVLWIVPPAVVAGFGGALLADRLDAATLQRIFGVVIVYFALNMIAGALRGARTAPAGGGE